MALKWHATNKLQYELRLNDTTVAMVCQWVMPGDNFGRFAADVYGVTSVEFFDVEDEAFAFCEAVFALEASDG